MGISTLRSYHGSQIFEAVGISEDVIDRYFNGTVSRIEGIGLKEIAEEAVIPHKFAFSSKDEEEYIPRTEGFYHYRKEGEHHSWNPETIGLLQWATKTNNYEKVSD